MAARPSPIRRDDIDGDVITKPNVSRTRPPLESTGTCVVGCKLPTGLQLQLSRPEPITEQTPSGSRQITIHRKYGDIHVLKGNRRRPGDESSDHLIFAGASLTPGIPRDFMRAWMEQNTSTLPGRSNVTFLTSGLL